MSDETPIPEETRTSRSGRGNPTVKDKALEIGGTTLVVAVVIGVMFNWGLVGPQAEDKAVALERRFGEVNERIQTVHSKSLLNEMHKNEILAAISEMEFRIRNLESKRCVTDSDFTSWIIELRSDNNGTIEVPPLKRGR